MKLWNEILLNSFQRLVLIVLVLFLEIDVHLDWIYGSIKHPFKSLRINIRKK